MSANLPSIPHDAYRYRDLSSQPVDELDLTAGYIGDYYRDKTNEEKSNHPLLPEEVIEIESILKFVDYCLPSNQVNRAPQSMVRHSRAVGDDVLAVCAESEVELDDLRQEARLAAIRTIRNFKLDYFNGRRPSVLSLVSYGIASHLTLVGARAIRGGFTGSRNPSSVGAFVEPMGHLARRALAKSIESGWSDDLQEVYAHPAFREKIDLDSAGITDSILAEEPYSFSQPSNEPIVDHEELSGQICTASSLDNLLSTLERCGVDLEERTVLFFQRYYIEGLTYSQIGAMEETPITQQAVNQIIQKGLSRIRKSPGVLEILSDEFL